MKQILLAFACVLVLQSKAQIQWIKTIGEEEGELITDIAADNAGNIYITGNFEDSLDFDPGPGIYKLWGGMSGSDAFLAKYTSSGNLIWAKSFGDTTHLDHGEKIALDNNGNVYLTGFFRNHVDFDPGPGTYTLNSVFVSGVPSRDIFVSKFDTAGNFQWVRAVGGGTFDAARDVVVDQSGDVYVTGNFQWTADFDPGVGTYSLTSAGVYDPFILKLSSSGNFIWARRFGGANQDQISSAGLDAAGNLYITGTFEGTTDLDPGPGTLSLTSNGMYDGFVSKITPAGNLIWTKRIGGTNNDYIEKIVSDPACNIYLSGGFQNTVDFDPGAGTYTLNSSGTDIFINKLDSAGNFIWAKQLSTSSAGGCTLWNSDRDAAGNLYFSGGFFGTSDLDPGPGTYTVSTSLPGGRMFICKLDSTGNFHWGGAFGRTITGSGTGGIPFAIRADNSGNVYCGGWFDGVGDLDPGPAVYSYTSSYWDMFLIKTGTDCLGAPDAPGVIQGPSNWCVGGGAQTYSVEAIAGATLYTWSLPSGWTGTSSSNTISLLPVGSGVFSVTASNACGMSAFSTLSLTVNSLPVLNASSNTTLLCEGENATLSVSGASTYTWSTGDTDTVIPVSPSVTSTYTIIGTDTNGCENSTQFTQSVSPLPLINASGLSTVMCSGESTTLTAGGASIYTWSPGGMGSSLVVSPSATTVYTVTGADNNGCLNSTTLGITINLLPNINISSNDSMLCSGESATLTANGAVSYSWATGGTTPSISVMPGLTSTYSVIGTDVNGCQNSSSFTQSVSVTTLTVTTTHTALCSGQAATLTATGAVGYSWNPGGTASNIQVTPTVTSTYSVIGTDSHGWRDSSQVSILVNPLPVISTLASPTIICAGETATLSAGGASTYTWSPGGTSSSIQVSPAVSTVYTVTASDLNSCQSSSTLALSVNPLPLLNASGNVTAVCAGTSATLSVSGASVYTWNPGGTGSSIVIFPSVTSVYTVTGTDANNCKNTTTLSMIVNTLPGVNASSNATSVCIGKSATLTASGANTYSWNPGGTGSSLIVSPNVLTAYTVTGTDANNCSNTATLSVGVNPLPNVNASGSNTVICAGETVTLSATGASTYVWNPGGSGSNIMVAPNVTSSYTVTGTDANNCTNTATLSIGVNPLPNVAPSANSTIICAGQSATLSASGATNYVWNPGGTGPNIVVSPVVTSTYTVSGTDANNCTNTATLGIGVNPLPNVSASASSTVICAGQSATLSASGATNYVWNPGGLGSNIIVSPNVSSNYTVSGTDANNCVNTATLSLGVNSLPNVNASASPTVVCAGESVTLSANGALNYLWSPGGAGSNIVVSPNVTSTYTVNGTDVNNCTNTATLVISVNPLPNIGASASPMVICAGESATLSASGASSYSWSPSGTGSVIIVSPAVTSIYTVTGTNSTNCKNSTTLSIIINTLPQLSISSGDTVLCIGEGVTLTAVGAATYTWDSGATGSSIAVSPTITSTYTLFATDSNNCQNSSAFTLSVSACTYIRDVDLSTKNMVVFPNPTSGKIMVSGLSTASTLEIYNSLGKLVSEPSQIKVVEDGVHEIDLSKEPNGIYFLKTDDRAWRIIKQ